VAELATKGVTMIAAIKPRSTVAVSPASFAAHRLKSIITFWRPELEIVRLLRWRLLHWRLLRWRVVVGVVARIEGHSEDSGGESDDGEDVSEMHIGLS